MEDVRPVQVRRLGSVSYMMAWDMQKELVARMAGGEEPETLLLLEHPHTYPIGKPGGWEHLIATSQMLEVLEAVVLETDRGGDITYHGPGQIVGYPLLDLRQMSGDVHWYLRTIEETLIGVLAEYGLEGERESDYTGVWCQDAKVAAIGVKISQGITMHGFALNVNSDLSYFDLIIPCGIKGRQVTSLQQLLGGPIDMDEALRSVERNFERAFGVRFLRHPAAVSA